MASSLTSSVLLPPIGGHVDNDVEEERCVMVIRPGGTWAPRIQAPPAPSDESALGIQRVQEAAAALRRDRPRWGGVAKPTVPLKPMSPVRRFRSAAKLLGTDDVPKISASAYIAALSARSEASSVKPSPPPLVSSKTARDGRCSPEQRPPPEQRRKELEAAATLHDLAAFDRRVPYGDELQPEGTAGASSFLAPPIMRGGVKFSAGGAAISGGVTTPEEAAARALRNPIFGLLIGVPLCDLVHHYEAIAARSETVRKYGMDLDAFRDFLAHIVPHFAVSASTAARIHEQYEHAVKVPAPRLSFFTFLTTYGRDASPAEVEKSLVFFFDTLGSVPPPVLAPGSVAPPQLKPSQAADGTVSAAYILPNGLQRFIEKRVRGTAQPKWRQLEAACHMCALDTKLLLQRLINDPHLLEAPAPRTAIERRVLGDVPTPPPPRVTLQQLRYVIYSQAPLLAAMRGLWFPVAPPNASRRGSAVTGMQLSKKAAPGPPPVVPPKPPAA